MFSLTHGLFELWLFRVSKRMRLFLLILLLISNLTAVWLKDVLPLSSLPHALHLHFVFLLLHSLIHGHVLCVLEKSVYSLVTECNILHIYIRLTCGLHSTNFVVLIFLSDLFITWRGIFTFPCMIMDFISFYIFSFSISPCTSPEVIHSVFILLLVILENLICI